MEHNFSFEFYRNIWFKFVRKNKFRISWQSIARNSNMLIEFLDDDDNSIIWSSAYRR